MSEFTDFEERRLKLYTSGLFDEPLQTTALLDKTGPYLAVAETTFAQFDAWVMGRKDFLGLANQRKSTRKAVYEGYVRPVVEMLRAHDLKKMAVLVVFFDFAKDLPAFALSKSRAAARAGQLANTPGRLVLFPLNHQRHWGDVGKTTLLDRPFARKKSRAVFRGSATAHFNNTDEMGRFSSARRRLYEFMKTPQGADLKSYLDVGFTDLGGSAEAGLKKEMRAHNLLASSMSMRLQLQYKFLLSVEGNDVASGLKWMAASRSTLLMPEPQVDSWFAESLLEPMRHYVPIADDFSNMAEQIEWCRANPRRCEEISREARAHVAQFLDQDREQKVKAEVFSGYVKRAQFKLDTHEYSGLSAVNVGRA